MSFHRVVGIDLGTTYSAVSVWDHTKGEIVVIPSATGSNTVPSVVGLDMDKRVIVGSPAQNNLANDPENTVIEVKREMGEYERKPDAQTDDPGEPRRIRFRGREYLPQEISAFILMELKRQAEAYIGEPIHDAVITVPAYFKEPQKGATEDAARMARLNVKRLLNEPTAAAVAFGADKIDDDDKDRHIYAVYDLGGGTFDVSIIKVSKGNVAVVGTGGNPRLGGGDFDDRITGYALEQIKAQYGQDLSHDPAIWARIKREAEMRKRELSAAPSAMLNLPFLTAQISANIPITRATFEMLIEDLLQESLACLDEAIESAYEANGIERDEIEQVLLVGGSSRIPRIRELLAEHLGFDINDVRADINPDEVVSRGAAMVARDAKPSTGYEGEAIEIDMAMTPDGEAQPGLSTADAEPAIVLQDVTSHTLGILVEQSTFFPIIPKESRLPAEKTQDGFINGGPAKEIPVMIFQGEDPVAFNNTLIGKLPIELPEPREQGFYKFEVTFALDNDGLLHVSVKNLNDGQIWQTDLQCNVRATKEQIDSSAEHLADVMASGSSQGNGAAAVAVPSALPKPPAASSLPRPPHPKASPPGVESAPVAAATPSATAPDAPAAPPANTPPEFKMIARRSFKLINQMPPSPHREKLVTAYTEFTAAVTENLPDIEEYGDELDDVFRECKDLAVPETTTAVPVPLPNTPDEFKAICRRSYKLINQLPPSDNRENLLSAYMAFYQAVQTNAADCEELGDTLYDIFQESR